MVQIGKSKAKTLTAIIFLAVIVATLPVISSLVANYIIRSSGSISYGPGQTLPLHTEGKYIKDSGGNTVFLRGVWKAEYIDTSTGWWSAQGEHISDGSYAHWDANNVRTQMEVMKNDWGINIIFAFIWGDWWLNNSAHCISAYQVPPYMTDKPYRDAVRESLTIAQDYGIYIQLRLYSPQAHYIPDTATPPTPGFGEGRKEFPYDTGEQWCSKVWTQQDFVNFWANVAAELQGYPNAILTLFDEPVTLYRTTPDPISGKSWYDTVIETVDAMRGTGYNGLIMLQWGYCGDCYWMEDFYNYLSAANRLDVLNNLVFSNHIYRYHGTFDGIGASTDYNTMKNYIYANHPGPAGFWPPPPGTGLHYNRIVNELNLPVIVTAIGAFAGATDEAEYTSFRYTLAILNELEIGYAAYQWHRTDLPWAIQTGWTAIQPPNRVGQALIDAIAAGRA